jgi:hypothetical protein
MFLVGILTWWYGHGWRDRLAMISGRIGNTSDYFSIGLLVTTLFSPFRQISAGSVDGPLGVQMRAMADRLISRIIGAIARSFMIIFGIIAICFQAVFGGLILIAWMVVPLFPIIGLLMSVIGWTPSWQ